MRKIRRMRRVRRFEATRIEFKPSYRHRAAEFAAHCQCPACATGLIHASCCAVHNEPAYPNGPCNCGVQS